MKKRDNIDYISHDSILNELVIGPKYLGLLLLSITRLYYYIIIILVFSNFLLTWCQYFQNSSKMQQCFTLCLIYIQLLVILNIFCYILPPVIARIQCMPDEKLFWPWLLSKHFLFLSIFSDVCGLCFVSKLVLFDPYNPVSYLSLLPLGVLSKADIIP